MTKAFFLPTRNDLVDLVVGRDLNEQCPEFLLYVYERQYLPAY